jgi:hypothetical protein
MNHIIPHDIGAILSQRYCLPQTLDHPPYNMISLTGAVLLDKLKNIMINLHAG